MHADLAAFGFGEIVPYFVGSEAKDGGDETREGLSDLPENGLGGAACVAGGREGVHAVLEHIDVEVAQVDDREVVNGVVDAMELEGFVPGADFLGELAGAGEHVPVER